MNPPVVNRRQAERFDQLLEEADATRHQHTRSPADDELARLARLGHRLSSIRPAVDADPDFRAELRAMLMATAEREGIGTTATAADAPQPSGRRARRPRPAFAGHRGRTRAAIIAGVAAGAIAVSGISTASDNSLPGDALYGMKRSTEKAQLALSGSDLSRGQLLLDFARTRLSEAELLREGSDGFVTLLDDMDADTREAVKLLATVAVQGKDQRPVDMIAAFLAEQSRRLRDLLDRTTGLEHQRLKASNALLSAVEKRLGLLGQSLACGPSGRSDALGPVPHACTAGSGPAGTVPGSPQREQEPARQVTPTRTPSASAMPDSPSASPSASSSARGPHGQLPDVGRRLAVGVPD